MTGPVSPSTDLGQEQPRSVRVFLVVAGVLVGITGVQLFVLTERTAEFFAWTVEPPITAAFLGAAYFGAMALEFTAARQAWWIRARIGVVAVAVFTVVTEIATLLHLDRFHLDAPAPVTRTAAWAWLIVYTAVPLWLLVLAVPILRRRVPAPAARLPLPAWLRAVLIVQGTVLVPAAAALFLIPRQTAPLWPWELTPLTARAVAAWLLAIGVLALHAAVERDLDRMRPLSAAWLTFGGFQIVAIVRYPAMFEWASVGGVAVLGLIASTLLLGGATVWLTRQALRVPAQLH